MASAVTSSPAFDERKGIMNTLALILLLLILIPLIVAISTAIFRWLWNITMPQVFGLREITFWQAFRLLLLAGFLFGAGSFAHFNVGK